MNDIKEVVSQLMFSYSDLRETEIINMCARLDRKILRWLGAHHPDNRTRKIFFELTNVTVGTGTVLNSGLVISDGYLPLVRIGERVAISPNVIIIAQSGPNNSMLQNVTYVKDHLMLEAPVTIEDDAWIGAGAVLLPGVTVGRMSVIGAGAVVTKSIAPYSIASGIPAAVTRTLESSQNLQH